MIRRLAVLALLATSTPAWAQATSTPEPDSTALAQGVVDPVLVGEWTLVEVENEGRMAVFGAEIEEMACTFKAEGEGTVEMTVVQDRETIEADRSFKFETVDGRILVNDAEPIGYAVLETGEVRLSMPDGLVVRLRRADDARG